MCLKTPLTVYYPGCNHTLKLIVGTHRTCTGHCHPDETFHESTAQTPTARSNRRFCTYCYSDSPQLPSLRRPAPAHTTFICAVEVGAYQYFGCLGTWRMERARHERRQERRGRESLEGRGLEEEMWGVGVVLEGRRRRRVYREEEEEGL